MMRTTGIAIAGISVYRLAAGAETGAAAGDGLLSSGKCGILRDRVPGEDGDAPCAGSGRCPGRLVVFFLRRGIEQAAQCRRVQRVEVEAHPGFVQKGGQGFFRIQGALFRQPGGGSPYQLRSGHDGGHGVLLFVDHSSRVRFGKQRVFGSKGRHIWIICGLRSSSASWKG